MGGEAEGALYGRSKGNSGISDAQGTSNLTLHSHHYWQCGASIRFFCTETARLSLHKARYWTIAWTHSTNRRKTLDQIVERWRPQNLRHREQHSLAPTKTRSLYHVPLLSTRHGHSRRDAHFRRGKQQNPHKLPAWWP